LRPPIQIFSPTAASAEFGFEKTQIRARNNFNCQAIEAILIEEVDAAEA
jgi:hypothetical protein